MRAERAADRVITQLYVDSRVAGVVGFEASVAAVSDRRIGRATHSSMRMPATLTALFDYTKRGLFAEPNPGRLDERLSLGVSMALTAVFMWMNSHRAHGRHRGHNDFSACSVTSVANRLHTFENWV
jgi:hypothetical protein